MIVTITGVGVWTRGLYAWDDFLRGMTDGFAAVGGDFVPPKPQAIPARERRRAGLTINLAVEVTHQACAMAGADPSTVASVFTSAMGDTDITDYLCRKLAADEMLLSPTQFHNSVHNAPSGYWSISASNRQPSSFAGGFRDSFAGGLLEAAACAGAERLPVVLTAYDIANRAPFGDVLPISESLALALLMVPGSQAGGWPLEVSVEAGSRAAPSARHEVLRRLADANPIGTGLTLLEAMAERGSADPACADTHLHWPAGSGSTLHVRVGACRARRSRGHAAEQRC